MDVLPQPGTHPTSPPKTDVFTPLNWSMKEIRDAIPARLFVRNAARSTIYLARDLILAAALWKAASLIDPYFNHLGEAGILRRSFSEGFRWTAWMAYWWFQGLVFTGLWVIGHECGHGAFSSSRALCDSIGFVLHTALWTPYFSWHHSNHASMERDEVYVPSARAELNIPSAPNPEIDWDEIFGDTPIYTLFRLIRQQLLAFPAYLLMNVSDHGAEATLYLSAFLGDHYMRSSEPVFQALWNTYNECQFVEDEGDILFYRNKRGEAQRRSIREVQTS
ncbi:hypothetical protein RSAG8_01195, partial [Rhizoctonia solani AG-8 WAC10335]